jgi:hypothetical protein
MCVAHGAIVFGASKPDHGSGPLIAGWRLRCALQLQHRLNTCLTLA